MSNIQITGHLVLKPTHQGARQHLQQLPVSFRPRVRKQVTLVLCHILLLILPVLCAAPVSSKQIVLPFY